MSSPIVRALKFSCGQNFRTNALDKASHVPFCFTSNFSNHVKVFISNNFGKKFTHHFCVWALMIPKIHDFLKSLKKVLRSLFRPPLNKGMLPFANFIFMMKKWFFSLTNLLLIIIYHNIFSSYLYFGFFSSKEFHFISLKKHAWSIQV